MHYWTFFLDYNNNESSVLKHCLRKNQHDIIEWLHKEDILIVDRGFRDAISAIKHFSYEAVMPSFVNRKHQLNTQDANHSCLITKFR